MNLKLPKLAQNPDRFRNILAFGLVAVFESILPLLIFKTIPTENKEIITYMIGQISGMAATAVAFYFTKPAGTDALDTKRADTTAKMAEAVTAAIASTPPVVTPTDVVTDAVEAVADAATAKAEEIKADPISGQTEGTV